MGIEGAATGFLASAAANVAGATVAASGATWAAEEADEAAAFDCCKVDVRPALALSNAVRRLEAADCGPTGSLTAGAGEADGVGRSGGGGAWRVGACGDEWDKDGDVAGAAGRVARAGGAEVMAGVANGTASA